MGPQPVGSPQLSSQNFNTVQHSSTGCRRNRNDHEMMMSNERNS